MALYLLMFLLGAITVALVVFTWVYAGSRLGATSDDSSTSAQDSTGIPAQAPTRFWSAHVGSLDEPVGSTVREETPLWQRHLDAAQGIDPGVYKTRRTSPFAGEHWDPYAESQSTASKAKSARRRPRPHRSHHGADRSTPADREIDAFALLGVSRVASSEEIERAYRRRVASIHPDKFHGDPVGQRDAVEKLKQLNLAMKVVRDRLARGEGGRGEVTP